MNCIHVGNFRGADDSIRAQIAICTLGAADANGFIGKLHMQGLNIGFGIDGQGLDTHFATRANNPECDFTAVGDENLLNHADIKI
jgi:hypothetical protein